MSLRSNTLAMLVVTLSSTCEVLGCRITRLEFLNYFVITTFNCAF